MGKPIVLQLGDDIKWNHDLYNEFKDKFEIKRSYSMPRAEFIQALKTKAFGDFFAIYRPFWNTGGEMGNWDEELISLLPDSCKVYASAGAGFDWVDTETLAKRGIVYCNAAAACTESVADAAIWLIISTFRLLSWSAVAARSGDTEQFVDANRNLAPVSRNPNAGFSLGIIGFGRIGRRIAEKAYKALDMKILYNDVVQAPKSVEQSLEATFHKSADTLLAEADCVLVATPFAGETLLSKAGLAKMKKGARLVNIARGKLIDEADLVEALKSGHLSAAGLDVFQNEPHISPELVKMKNVELLSHNAGASLDSHIGFEKLGMENIISFEKTGKAISGVNVHLIKQSKL
ncbi:D-isomer specific 2-hydroxyacid dehydrogenase [Thelonectria olida]|uniref:D-isomer specific 2-hydroxyacid dehydrogenase n=1 Tax=Thelonectria olida TaxID=1576542 RepID=A0A9P8VU10_9HYPO|nr:D-isomer specific 2-hydroxyacid dehydrogenase [Thelonectria olida]